MHSQDICYYLPGTLLITLLTHPSTLLIHELCSSHHIASYHEQDASVLSAAFVAGGIMAGVLDAQVTPLVLCLLMTTSFSYLRPLPIPSRSCPPPPPLPSLTYRFSLLRFYRWCARCSLVSLRAPASSCPSPSPSSQPPCQCPFEPI